MTCPPRNRPLEEAARRLVGLWKAHAHNFRHFSQESSDPDRERCAQQSWAQYTQAAERYLTLAPAEAVVVVDGHAILVQRREVEVRPCYLVDSRPVPEPDPCPSA